MRQPSLLRRAAARMRASRPEAAGGGMRGTRVWEEDERVDVAMERARAQAGDGWTTPEAGMLVSCLLEKGDDGMNTDHLIP